MAGHIQEVDSSRRVVANFGPVDSSSGPVPALGKGWIAFGRWIKPSGDSITVDSTTWVVPPFPTSHDGQTAFLWNGLESNLYLLQPVLQWGPSETSDYVWHGGNYWSTACWFINGNLGSASSFVTVSSGDTLVGEVIMYPDHPDGGPMEYSCRVYRRGVILTSMVLLGSNELYKALETLEAFSMQQCSDYPQSVGTTFGRITIRTTSGTPALSWTPVDSVTDCGQYASIGSNANPGGEVDVYYGLNVSLSGASVIPTPGTYTWYANASSGTGSYTYQWQYQNQGSSTWNPLGTGQSQSRYVDASTPNFTLKAIVTSGSEANVGSLQVTWNDVTGVSIDGPTLVWIGEACTWGGTVTTGTPPLVFQWDVDGQGDQNPVQVDTTNTSSDFLTYQANSVANPFTISLTVTDAARGSGFTWITVNPAGYGCGS
jgi:hypothetical protein